MNNLQFQKYIKNLNKQDAKDFRKLERDLKRLERDDKKNTQRLIKINIKNSKKQAIEAKQLIKKNKNDMKKLKNIDRVIKKYERLLKKQEIEFKRQKKEQKKRYMQPKKINIHCYLYVIARRLDKPSYNFKDPNIYQYDSLEIKKYARALKFNLIINEEYLTKYQVNKFYNDNDDGIEFIDTFKDMIKPFDNILKDSMNNIEISDTIVAFKIIRKTPHDYTYTEPVFNEELLENDITKKAITNEYTKYKINLQANSFKDIIENEHCDYVKENFRPSSCFLTAIINKFYAYFEKRDKNNVRYHKELTYSYLCQILNIPDKPFKNAVSFNMVVNTFCKKFNFVGLYAYDCYNKLRVAHKPIDKKNSISLRVLIHDGHVYEMNDCIKSLEQKINDDDDEIVNLIVSNKYNIMEKKQESLELFCHEPTEIIDAIKINSKNEDILQLKIISYFDIKTVLFCLIDGGYIPKVSVSGMSLSKITIKLNKLVISIIPSNNSECDGQLVTYSSLEEYKAYTNAFDKFYKSIVHKDYLSDYHHSVQEIENTYKIIPLSGYLNTYNNQPLDILDENRAYIQCLKSITNVPVFNYFDVYKHYNNEEIEDYTYYIIEVLEISQEASIIFDNKFSRTFGYILKKINIKFKIIYYRKPLNIEDVNFNKAVQELYEDKNISDRHKKAIGNLTIGMYGKKCNRAELSKIFLDYNEANYYAIKYEGKMTVVEDDDICSKYLRGTDVNKKIFVVQVEEKKQLINGFMPINDMIYIDQRMKLLQQYQKMKKLNIKMVGIKTDCILYEGHHDDIIKQNFKLTERIGDYKIQKHKYVVNKLIKISSNELVNIQKYDVVPKIFDNEFDTVTINEYISSNKQKPLLIKGNYPGVGKSVLCKNYDSNCLFICPYNKLCQVTRTDGIDSITYSKLFGLISTDIEMINVKRYDISKYNTIVFDEIFLYEPARLKRISELMESNKNKVFMATGDIDQRDSISFKNSEYIKHCMDLLFQNQILLNDIKRFKNVDDKIKLILLKNDILNTNMSVKDICIKHGINMITEMKDVKTTTNIALFNFRCTLINNHIHKNVLKQTKNYYDGLDIICKKYERTKNFVINTNYTYKIIKFGEKYIKIKDEVENIDYTIPMSILINNFKLPYALTLDSVQGLSFNDDEKVTIFDCNVPYTDKKYFWTALTRARKIENVSVFIHSDEEIEKLTHSRIKLHFNNLISLYKIQDKKNNKEFISSDYINIEWIQMNIEKNKNNINIYIDDNAVVHSNVYINRIEQSKAYTINNSQFIFKK